MTTIRVTGLVETREGLVKIRRELRKTKSLFNMFGRGIRDDARNRITTQDNGTYPKLGKWARARTGRRKALITERKNISFKLVGNNLVIGHTATGWNIQDHEKGFTTPGFVGKPVTIPLRNPNALEGVTGNSISIRRAKASNVPARRVFATEREAVKIMQPIADAWLKKIIARTR